jgi:hypothetical protein
MNFMCVTFLFLDCMGSNTCSLHCILYTFLPEDGHNEWPKHVECYMCLWTKPQHYCASVGIYFLNLNATILLKF